jgi:hypothetical protein
MRRQPRIDHSKLSYNFEQFRHYTKFFKEAKTRDDQASQKFYKLVKYVKQNQSNMADPLVRNFVINDDLDPNLIDIPEEFKDLSIEDVTPSNYRRSVIRKKFVRNKSNKCLTNYDAWRCFDRTLFKGGGNHPSVARILVAPADLVKAFGNPSEPDVFDTATGEYNFEDNNLDCYALFDHKETDFYHGMNKEDEYYTTPENMKKAPHKRKRKYPNV